MAERTPAARIRVWAAPVAVAAWAGLGLQTAASAAQAGSLAGAWWAMSGYFTILTNLGIAVLFSGIALGCAGFDRPARIGGATLCILLVGIVYALLLSGLQTLTGPALAADILLHRVTPVLAALFWLLAVPRGGLRWGDPARWALLPLAYLIYAILRGGWQGHYAYPFLDGPRLGWREVAATVLAIGAGFLLAGWAMVWFDRGAWPSRGSAWRR